MDSGFCDKKIYRACEELGVGYVSSGCLLEQIKLLEAIKDGAETVPEASWAIYQDGPDSGPGGLQEWAYHERLTTSEETDVEPGASFGG